MISADVLCGHHAYAFRLYYGHVRDHVHHGCGHVCHLYAHGRDRRGYDHHGYGVHVHVRHDCGRVAIKR